MTKFLNILVTLFLTMYSFDSMAEPPKKNTTNTKTNTSIDYNKSDFMYFTDMDQVNKVCGRPTPPLKPQNFEKCRVANTTRKDMCKCMAQ